MSFNHVEANNLARDQYIQGMMNTYQRREQRLQGRRVEFLTRNRSAGRDLALLTLSGAAGGAGVGAIAGGIIGGTCGTPGGPPGILAGVVIGGGIGALIGAGIGAGIGVIVLRPRYNEWCRTEAGIEFGDNMKIFLKEDSILQHLTCAISDLPVIEGVRTPNGQLYEKHEIIAWIEKNGTDPLTRELLSKKDLVEDESASVESSKKIVTFLKSKREETVNNAPHLIEGFDALITDYREAAMCKHNNKLAILQKKWRENRITYEEFSQKSLALGDKYLNLL